MKNYKIHPFEKALEITHQSIEINLNSIRDIEWDDFLLNPRRLRGSDFLMRWSQGVWSERRLVQAINSQSNYYAIPYGPSSTAPEDDVRNFELYFERLDKAGLGDIKRPDLLIFKEKDRQSVDKLVSKLGGFEELPFTEENQMKDLLAKTVIGVECENSLWVAEKMPDYKTELKPMRRLDGKPGLRKGAVLPTIIIKEEDREPLKQWQTNIQKPIHIWHVFYDRAYGISLDEAERLFREGLIEPTIQTFQAPGGATTKKAIYKIYYRYAYPLGIATEKPKLIPAHIEDKNGHILPYVRFEGGKLKLTSEAVEILQSQ